MIISSLRKLFKCRFAFPAVLYLTIGLLTSWATWTGYTANQSKATPQPTTASPANRKENSSSLHLDKGYGRLPLSFEANKGQFDSSAKFVARGPGFNILLNAEQAVLALRRSGKTSSTDDPASPDSDTPIGAQRLLALRGQTAEPANGAGNQALVTMRFAGANAGAKGLEGVDELPGKANYFLGNDSAKWLTDIRTYERVAYREIYQGVDLVFYGSRQQLEYDLVVAPNADPSAIQLVFDGVQGIKSDRQGGLTLATPAGELTQAKPVIYQDIDGQRKTINGSYVIKPGNKIGFKVSKYDRARPLVIDPTLSYLSFVNGSGQGFALAADASGNTYITGFVSDSSLGVTPGVVQATNGGLDDCFVTKLNPTGTEVVFTTYLGGTASDYGNSIAVDAGNNVYVGGYTESGFPTTAGAYQTIFAGISDGFVTKLNPTGSALIYSTYFGGNGTEEVDTVVPEAGTGNIFISGLTASADFNTTPGAFRSANTGGFDAFVGKLNATGSNTLYLTYAGGSGFEYPISMTADPAGNVYLVGQTTSLDFPTVNPAQAALGGRARGPFKSNTGGASYALSNNGLPVTYVYCSAINPTTPSTIYLGTDGGVFKSTNSGGSWSPTGQLQVPRVHQLTLVPGAPNIIYAGTEAGVYRSTDGGATWLARNTGLISPGLTADVRGIAIHQSAPNTIYIAGTTGVFKSTDGGGSWVAINTGLATDFINALTNAIVIDPTAANTLYVALPSAQRVYKTTNGGTSWSAAGTGMLSSMVRALAINPQSPNTLYAAQAAGISKTVNGGTSWTAANTGLNLTLSDSSVVANAGMHFVTVDPVTPTTVYAGASLILQNNGAFSTATVFKSLDSGGTWTAQSNGFVVPASIATIAIDPANPATVYAGSLGDNDSFILKLNPAGTTELFGTYFGGNRGDSGTSIAADATQNIYIAGNAASVDFPTTGGAFQTVLKGNTDLFVARFSAGGVLSFSTLIGGVEADNTGGGIAVDSSNNVFVTGSTFAPDFPTTPGAFQRTIGNPGTRAADIFITKVNASGSSLDFSSYLGGGGNDYANNFLGQRLALDAAGNVFIVGVTASTNFPYFDWANCCGNSSTHTFVAKISSALPSYSITGRVTKAGNIAVAGVFVQALDSRGNFIRGGLTDAQGYYALISLPANSYTVTPQRYDFNSAHYIFAPPSRTFSVLNSDQSADFTATQVYDIQGQITHSTLANVPIFDVTVTLSGTSSATAISNAGGGFVFRDLVAGSYTVTPSKSGFTFNPVNRSYAALSADQFATFTTASGSFFTISGRAADGNNAAISNATVALQVRPQIGSRPLSAQTDASGNYSFANLQAGGNYTLLAAKPLVSFVPLTQTFNNLAGNQTLNFTGTAPTGLIGKLSLLKDVGAQTDLATLNADGSNETSLLTILNCGDGGPSWSPNGAKIAFSQCGNTGTEDLFVVNADGTGLTVLSNQPDSEGFPSWSPDGTRLTYTAGDCSGTDVLVPEVFAINANGSLRTNLTNNNVVDGLSDWSPNASTIVFARGPNASCSSSDTDTDLYVVDAIGGNERRLTTTPEVEELPAYSPDGSKIAYTRSFQNLANNTFSRTIFVMNADGTGQTQITSDIIDAGRPTWSPDGTKLAFDGFLIGANSPTQIYAVNADGTGLVQITSDASIRRTVPSWQHYSISGRVTGNTTGVPITMTLAGTLTRVTQTDSAGNYVFGNLTPGGNYSVTPISNAFGFNPGKADVNNLIGNQVANFVVLPAVIPAPTPPLTDDFAGAQRDPTKWNLGTQTQPLGAFDPQIPVVQQNGRLVVTPRSQTNGLHYNGYVSLNSFDFNNSKATVEVVQPAANGAETIFAIGSDLDNFSRFVVRAGATGASPQKGRRPVDVGGQQLIFQVRISGQLTSLSIPYDSDLHRFMRFRHEPPTNSILFETSSNNIDFTVRHRVVLQKSVSALTAELSAGTTSPTDSAQAIFDNFGLVTNTVQFSVSGYTVNESEGRAVITVARSGDLSGTASVDYSTFDETARQRNRYIPAVGTLSFAAGQSTRTFSVLVEDNLLVEGTQTIELRLLDSSGAGLNSPGRAILTVEDNDSLPITTNPLDNVQFFVRQNYYDFLSRNPDPGGLDYWTSQFTPCGSDQICINNKRLDVSNAFYFELEFQQTGSYVYRLYRAVYGNNQPFPNPDTNFPNENKKLLSYNSFVNDRARVVGGPDLAQSQLALANSFINRREFLATYPLSLDGPGFVDAVLSRIRTDIGVDLTSQRAGLIALFNSGGRGAVIYRLADDNAANPINNRPFIDAEYNRAFVTTQYFGYLRRNPDLGGFLFWLGQVNGGALRDVEKQHAMVCSFVTSTEYQNRFSLTVTHNNGECPH